MTPNFSKIITAINPFTAAHIYARKDRLHRTEKRVSFHIKFFIFIQINCFCPSIHANFRSISIAPLVPTTPKIHSASWPYYQGSTGKVQNIGRLLSEEDPALPPRFFHSDHSDACSHLAWTDTSYHDFTEVIHYAVDHQEACLSDLHRADHFCSHSGRIVVRQGKAVFKNMHSDMQSITWLTHLVSMRELAPTHHWSTWFQSHQPPHITDPPDFIENVTPNTHTYRHRHHWPTWFP